MLSGAGKIFAGASTPKAEFPAGALAFGAFQGQGLPAVAALAVAGPILARLIMYAFRYVYIAKMVRRHGANRKHPVVVISAAPDPLQHREPAAGVRVKVPAVVGV